MDGLEGAVKMKLKQTQPSRAVVGAWAELGSDIIFSVTTLSKSEKQNPKYLNNIL